MTVIEVPSSKKYNVVIGNGVLDGCGEKIRQTVKGEKACIVSDDNVYPLWGEKLKAELVKTGYDVFEYVFPHGEKSKNPENLIQFLRFLAQSEFARTDVVCTLGGGVTGDFGALAAGMYNRGMKLVAVPTSLLAMVDSSVGGKTAVDLPEGKNLIGMFFQPDIVLCDIGTLKTLPEDFMRDGMAEVIKYGVIRSASLFEKLKNFDVMSVYGENGTADGGMLEEIIAECISIKRDVVQADEFDRGLRQLLNFGHTIAHGIEMLSGYTIPHGSAVAAGMVSISKAAAAKGICSMADAEEIELLVNKNGLPVKLPFAADDLAKAAVHDKKRSGRSITIVLPVKIGNCDLKKIPVDEMIEYIGE